MWRKAIASAPPSDPSSPYHDKAITHPLEGTYGAVYPFSSPAPLPAPGLFRGDSRPAQGAFPGGVALDLQPEEGAEGHRKGGRPAAPVDDGAHPDHPATQGFDEPDHFPDRSPRGDHILRHQEALARFNRKSA